MIVNRSTSVSARVLETDGSSSLDAYFEEVGDHQNLSREDQDLLFGKLDAICPNRLSLGRAIVPAECRPIRAEIASHFYKLVIRVASKFQGQGVLLGDLIQEGNIGLMKGIWKFDNKKGTAASTYITWWIRQSVARAVADQGRTIRVPVHELERWKKITRAVSRMKSESGVIPVTDEIAAEINIAPEQVINTMKNVAGVETDSLDEIQNDDDGVDGYHFVGDGEILDTHVERSALADSLMVALEKLTAREQQILEMRFGVGSHKPMTLREVGQILKMSRERIRQIEKGALAKLRHPRLARQLKEFCESL